MQNIFVGPNGIRAGWRLLIFAAIFFAQVVAVGAIARLFEHHQLTKVLHVLPPWFGLVQDLPLFAMALIAAFVMSRIEHRPMGAYGLPWRSAFRGKFWFGALAGFVSLSLVLAVMAASHAFRITSVTTIAPIFVATGVLYLVTFLFTGFFEEFLFRGYAQYTLGQGIGFWPAAVLLSALFAFAHTQNGGESLAGLAQVFVFGMVFCYVLARTGNLWFAVGYHMAWDWGESFFYGVPDSGTVASPTLLHGVFTGPAWLTGGSPGPEGSILSSLVLLLLVVVITFVPGGSTGRPPTFERGRFASSKST